MTDILQKSRTGERRSSAVVVPLMMAAGLGACGQTPRPATSRPPMVQAISNTQQLSDVVASLEVGDLKRARRLLKAMAKRDPADRSVRTLIESLDADPAAVLGTRAFSYMVQRGDRLQTLAQKFLGDRLKFFLLARYNGLAAANIAPGQMLRIPGVEPAAPPPAPPSSPRPHPEPRPTASPAPAPSKTSPAAASASPSATTNPAAAASLRGQGLRALDQGKVAVAVGLLRRARTLDPNNATITRDLGRAERINASVKARK